MSDRTLTWLLVPASYVIFRLVTGKLFSGAWDLRAEALALMVVVPLTQLVVLDLVRWWRGRGL